MYCYEFCQKKKKKWIHNLTNYPRGAIDNFVAKVHQIQNQHVDCENVGNVVVQFRKFFLLLNLRSQFKISIGPKTL